MDWCKRERKIRFPRTPEGGMGDKGTGRNAPACVPVACQSCGPVVREDFAILSQESLLVRRLPWCTCVSASARQSRAQCRCGALATLGRTPLSIPRLAHALAPAPMC